MKEKPSLGEQELEILRFVSEHSPISVGDVVAGFGKPRGLARTTVLTVMERLRTKGYLSRRMVNGFYRYTAKVAQDDLLKGLVSNFVERSLGGSLSPFVTYLADTGRLSNAEIAELRRMVELLETEEREVS